MGLSVLAARLATLGLTEVQIDQVASGAEAEEYIQSYLLPLVEDRAQEEDQGFGSIFDDDDEGCWVGPGSC